MPLDAITNRGEFFSNHYLAAIISTDIRSLRKVWEDQEGRDEPSPRSRLTGGAAQFFSKRASAAEAGRTSQAIEVQRLNDATLALLGFQPNRTDSEFVRADNTDLLQLQTAATLATSTGLLVVAVDAGLASIEHLDYYLDEFVFRFNRRSSRSRGKLFYRLVQQAVAVDPTPYRSIVADWDAEIP